VTVHQSLYAGGRPGQAKHRRHLNHFAGDFHVHKQPEIVDMKSPAVDMAGVICFNQQTRCDIGIDLRLERIYVDSLGGIQLCHVSETGYISKIDQTSVLLSAHRTSLVLFLAMLIKPKPIKIS
jgi:hypothetical protein